jgi:hypothetical protein
MSESNCFEEITSNLEISGYLKDIMGFIPKSFTSQIFKPTKESQDKIKSVLGNSQIELNILSDRIQNFFGLRLPIFEFVKPPKNIGFPYESSISLYGNDVKAIQINTAPILVAREKNGIVISGSAEVVPVNSNEAAEALAFALNPILAAYPTVLISNFRAPLLVLKIFILIYRADHLLNGVKSFLVLE